MLLNARLVSPNETCGIPQLNLQLCDITEDHDEDEEDEDGDGHTSVQEEDGDDGRGEATLDGNRKRFFLEGKALRGSSHSSSDKHDAGVGSDEEEDLDDEVRVSHPEETICLLL